MSVWCLSDDRHRVKLHSLLADPCSDYVNANYIDVSPPSPHPRNPLAVLMLPRSPSGVGISPAQRGFSIQVTLAPNLCPLAR